MAWPELYEKVLSGLAFTFKHLEKVVACQLQNYLSITGWQEQTTYEIYSNGCSDWYTVLYANWRLSCLGFYTCQQRYTQHITCQLGTIRYGLPRYELYPGRKSCIQHLKIDVLFLFWCSARLYCRTTACFVYITHCTYVVPYTLREQNIHTTCILTTRRFVYLSSHKKSGYSSQNGTYLYEVEWQLVL